MDMTLTITARGAVFDGRAKDVIARELHALVQGSVLLVERLVKEFTPQGIGGTAAGLYGSIFSEMRGAPARPEGIVATPYQYAEVIERGRRAGARMPPPKSLELWVEKVMGVPEEDIKQVAFLVARSIGRKGFKGQFMFKQGVEKAKPVMERMFGKAGYDIKVALEKS